MQNQDPTPSPAAPAEAAPQPPAQPQPEPPAEAQRNGVAAAISTFFAYWLVSWFLVPAALVVILHFYVFSAFHVVGSSMIPTLHDSDYLIVSKVQRTASLLAHDDYIPHSGRQSFSLP